METPSKSANDPPGPVHLPPKGEWLSPPDPPLGQQYTPSREDLEGEFPSGFGSCREEGGFCDGRHEKPVADLRKSGYQFGNWRGGTGENAKVT